MMARTLRIPGSSFEEIARWALLGMEQDRQVILARITEIKSQLDGSSGSSRRREHRISEEGRAAIAAAQTKRWAKTRREKRLKAAQAPRWVGKGRSTAPKPRKRAASPPPPPQVESPEVN